MISPVHGTVNYHHLDLGGGNIINTRLSGDPSACTAAITVDAASPPTGDGSSLTLGGITLVEGLHWDVIEDDMNATAANLAAAINNLSEFSAVVDGVSLNQVNVEGAKGPHQIVFQMQDHTGNMTLDPSSGVMSEGQPARVGPDID